MKDDRSPRQSPPPGPSGSPGGPPAPELPRAASWGQWLVMLLLLAINLYFVFTFGRPRAAELSYTDFLQAVQSGAVATVTINGQHVEGTFREPTAWPPASAGAPESTVPEPTRYTRFTTTIPPLTDQSLVNLLVSQGVGVTAEDANAGTWLRDLAIGLLPALVFVGVLLLIARQAQSGQQSVFGFGGSRARLYNPERPSVTLADVAGVDEAKDELHEIVSFLKSPARYRALGARLPRGVLLVGPPGTGKTLLARAVAGEAGVPFFSISASEFVEMFVGVGASRVRDLFAKAKQQAPAIVFVDELDAVGRERGANLGGGHDEREQTLNQLLVEMDGFDEETNIIVLAATNRPDVLDPALLRPGRFDRHVTLGLPDRAGREAILRVHTRRLPLAPDVSLTALARESPGFSGADLANLANEAALAAARRGAARVSPADFEEAMDRLVFGTRQASVMSQEERRMVAYHESGHALVAKLTPGADPVSKVTIIPHGRSLGATAQLPEEDRHNYSREYLAGRLTVLLGGRAAEELTFGQPTTGAENDLKQATSLARRMVGLWGMSPRIGPVAYGLGETHPFLGREIGQPREYAEATAAVLDAAVSALIDESYQQARTVLETHRSELTALAEELITHETLDGPQIDALLEAEAPVFALHG